MDSGQFRIRALNQKVPLTCGGRGIRTPGDLRLAAFQEPCIRPLCHPSQPETGYS